LAYRPIVLVALKFFAPIFNISELLTTVFSMLVFLQVYFESFLALTITTIAGKFKREDLARSLLNFFVLDLVQCVQLICSCHGIKRIFFCGSFGCTPLVRRLITTEFVRRNLYLMSFVSVTHLSVFVLIAVDRLHDQRLQPIMIIINLKAKFIKTVIGDLVAHLKQQKFTVSSDL